MKLSEFAAIRQNPNYEVRGFTVLGDHIFVKYIVKEEAVYANKFSNLSHAGYITAHVSR